jgi:hypothetical protein
LRGRQRTPAARKGLLRLVAQQLVDKHACGGRWRNALSDAMHARRHNTLLGTCRIRK